MSSLYDIESEFYLLALGLHDSDIINDLVADFDVKDFFDERHRYIFSAISDIYKKENAITFASLKRELGENISKAGSLNYLLEFLHTSSFLDFTSLKETIKQKRHVREIYQYAIDISSHVNEKVDYEEFIDQYRARAFKVFDKIDDNTVYSLSNEGKEMNVYKEALANAEAYKQGIRPNTGISSGYYSLDNFINGFAKGHLIIVGARTSMGKSTLMTNMCLNMEKHNPMIFSLEMPAHDLITKMIFTKAQVNLKGFKEGKLDPKDIQNIHGYTKELGKRTVIIDDTPAIKPSQMLARIRRHIMLDKVDIVFIDYLQLMRGDDRKYESNEVRVASISRELKRMAKLLDIPIIALAQLNRELEKRENKKPKISDLRESGSIEADADLILLLHRPSFYDIYDKPGILQVFIGKNRFGECGVCDLRFNMAIGKIED